MRKQNFRLFITSLFFALAMLVSAGSILAQSNRVMKINIPFDFNVGNKAFTAGDYNVSRTHADAFLVRNTDGKSSIIIPASSFNNQEAKAERLVFNRYGDKYFLRQIFSNRNANGFAVAESKTEKNIQRELALEKDGRKNINPEQVAVSAGN